MIRYVSLNAFIGLWSILMCLWGLAISVVDKNGRKVHFHCAVPWARTILRVCGIRVNVQGLENVDPNVPRIYMTNHQSFFDIFALLACLPVNFKFILKQELMKIPFLGPAMKKAGYIGIEREDPRKAVLSMKQAADRIRNGASVVIFPEGTRSSDGRLQEFKRGGFNLAIKAGCDIVPIGIQGSFRVAPKGSLRIRRGSFGLRIGRPVSLSGLGKRDIPLLMERVRTEMVTQMEAQGSETGAKGNAAVKTRVILLWLFSCLLWAVPGGSEGYVLPVEELIHKMTDRFSGFHALIVDQTAQVIPPREGEAPKVVQERVWLKLPRYCRSQIIGREKPPETESLASGARSEGPYRDTTFRWLLMADESDQILDLLSRQGVNIDVVALARLDGKVVYRIGDAFPKSPKLLIQRETYLPLLFSYVQPGSGNLVSVRFDNFKEVGSGGYYPYRIDYAVEQEAPERLFLLNLRVNPPIQTSFFEIAAKDAGSPEPETAPDKEAEERLEAVLQGLQKKYGK
jgi:1-acyl-sn-glycerol-3-phosphate acyltransferase